MFPFATSSAGFGREGATISAYIGSCRTSNGGSSKWLIRDMELNNPNFPDVIVGFPDYSSSLKLHVLPMEDKAVHYPSTGSTQTMDIDSKNSGSDQLF